MRMMMSPHVPIKSASTTCERVWRLSDAKNSGPERYPIVNTNRPKRIDLSTGGIVMVPNCPRTTATTKTQAGTPRANPRMRTRPSNVPRATARKIKISGAVEAA